MNSKQINSDTNLLIERSRGQLITVCVSVYSSKDFFWFCFMHSSSPCSIEAAAIRITGIPGLAGAVSISVSNH